MPLGRIGLSDAESQGKAAVQPGVSEIEIAAVVQAIHQAAHFSHRPRDGESKPDSREREQLLQIVRPASPTPETAALLRHAGEHEIATLRCHNAELQTIASASGSAVRAEYASRDSRTPLPIR